MVNKKTLIAAPLLLLSLNAVRAQLPLPTPEARPGLRWWWLGSAVDKPNLAWNMEQYARAGVGTVEITPIYGVQGNERNDITYLSPKWMEMLHYTEDEGRRNNIEIDMATGTGWPFGGPWVPLSEAACKATFADTVVNGKRRVTLHVGRTRQKVKRAAPGGEGWVIDHFDSTAVAHYLAHIDSAFTASGTPFPHTFFNDSYEVYGANWTPRLPEEFLKRRGYNLMDNLDKLVDGDPQVVSDYRETLAELLLKNFTNQWTAWAHRHGAITRNQAHGSPANLIDCYAGVDIPEIEGFGLTDFGIKGLRTDKGFTRPNFSDLSMLKYAPSAAHITGKKYTSSETFTWLTEHFRTSLSQMKPDLDLMFCAGVNRMFFHGTAYSPKDDPWPGWKFYASVDMSPTNSIWRDAPSLMAYITRCQTYLQWGQPDNDFLVYLPVRDLWREDTRRLLMMFDIHSMDKKAPQFIKTILAIDSLGYDCDYISDKYLAGVTVTPDGQLRTAAGTLYKGLVIPPGTTVDSRLQALIAPLQKQGKVICGIDVPALATTARPEAMKRELGLKIIRRSNPAGHHYFVANLTPRDVAARVPLAVEVGEAVWYNPMDSTFAPAGLRGGEVAVRLRSGESRILIVRDRPGDTARSIAEKQEATKPGTPDRHCATIDLSSASWRLSFLEEAPRVGKTFRLNGLRSWEQLSDSARVTMGTGVYETTFKLTGRQASARWEIDLGDVRESARVYINGRYLGCAWAVPFVLDCRNALKRGRNTLRIEVTNLPANRIADMDRRGVVWRKMKEINVVDINYKKTTYAGWEPLPGGLNSTVKLIEK
ncbi:glycosyl hydrolase [Segatella buccae]|uniref:Glycosyl hydrolase family 2, sugar binding domain protein n=1 Tax=Segatella buccae ATCC 33574 TaxID=873513 RepID=E6K5L9_9BACT|nr:glycosyl hydrolase [Segatella buccae]EFU31145.1 glycosyl hydrolase family 2, sugar binding domain protein [Segatella buccae ATCC 33574]